MNARNKLKTIDLMIIYTHIVYHASLKTDGSWGSKGSCHSDSPSRVGGGRESFVNFKLYDLRGSFVD